MIPLLHQISPTIMRPDGHFTRRACQAFSEKHFHGRCLPKLYISDIVALWAPAHFSELIKVGGLQWLLIQHVKYPVFPFRSDKCFIFHWAVWCFLPHSVMWWCCSLAREQLGSPVVVVPFTRCLSNCLYHWLVSWQVETIQNLQGNLL